MPREGLGFYVNKKIMNNVRKSWKEVKMGSTKGKKTVYGVILKKNVLQEHEHCRLL
jgi:hypothetical protein